MDATQFVRAREGFVTARKVDKNGEQTERSMVIKGGQVLAADHEIVRDYSDKFEPLVEESLRVETASANPGVARDLSTQEGRIVMAASKSKRGR